MSRVLSVLFAAALLASCASNPSTPVKVQDGDPAIVNRDCKLLGTVSGRSVFGGSDNARMEGAMQDARAKAAAMGATHIVFLTVDNSGMFNTGQTTARAYRCDAKAG
jgi:PBP1b-binding outer membrane lipoprotein LpoB